MTIKIKTNVLNAVNDKYNKKHVKNELARLDTLPNVPNVLKSDNVKKEIKRILIKHGLTLDYILSKYKEIVSTEIKTVRAGEVLKALERLEHHHGINVKQTVPDVPDVIVALQSKSDGEVKLFITRITSKTQEYMQRLDNVQDVQE